MSERAAEVEEAGQGGSIIERGNDSSSQAATEGVQRSTSAPVAGDDRNGAASGFSSDDGGGPSTSAAGTNGTTEEGGGVTPKKIPSVKKAATFTQRMFSSPVSFQSHAVPPGARASWGNRARWDGVQARTWLEKHHPCLKKT